MPDAPAKICPHCRSKVRGRCDCRRKAQDRYRGNSAARGYDRRWRKFRTWFLYRYPLCNDCGHAATEVHHIEKVSLRPELRLHEANCMPLCKACHTKRTMKGE